MTKSRTNFFGSSLAGKVNHEVYGETVRVILMQHYGHLKDAPKIIADRIDSRPETVRAWMAGRYAPRGAELINLMAICPPLQDAINKLTASRRETEAPGSARARQPLPHAGVEQRLRRGLEELIEALDGMNVGEAEPDGTGIFAVGGGSHHSMREVAPARKRSHGA